MFLVSPNDKRLYQYLGTSVGPSQMKILFTSHYQNIAFRNTVLSQHFEARFFLSIISCKILQSETRCRNRVKYDVLYTAGVWPTYFFVTGFIILLQCFSMIHKTGTILRNDEIWKSLLLEQIPTFGELYDKNTGPIHWKRNNFIWNLFQKCAVWNKAIGYHTHLVQHCFCPILEQRNPAKKSITQHRLGQNV